MTYTDQFIEYLETATSPIQSVSECIRRLDGAGFKALEMGDRWAMENGGAYYVRPFPTTLIAFKVGKKNYTQQNLRIITSHTDCPGFKLKPNPEKLSKGYLQLNTEVYSPPMFYTWMDRPLSLAGHVLLKSDQVLKPTRVEVDFLYPLMTIPSIAIHFNRTVNKEGAVMDPQKELLPIMELLQEEIEKEGYLNRLLADELGCDVETILDYDLYLYVKEEGLHIGPSGDMVSAPRVDNQASVYGSVQALMEAEVDKDILIAACFDNEEIGSLTKQGADSTLFMQVVERIAICIHKTGDDLYRMLEGSIMLSADGAHGYHPNYPEKNDVTNFPVLGGGLALKVSARQSYMTDGVSGAIFKGICDQAGLKYQVLVNRSNILGGKTLGPLAGKYLPMKGFDVGIPMLGMHSARELFSASDFEDMVQLFKYFYNIEGGQ